MKDEDTRQVLGLVEQAFRDVAGTCSDSTSLNDALRRVADKLKSRALEATKK